MNLTGNGSISEKEMNDIRVKHSGIYKRQADNYSTAEREEKRNESVRNR